ncbi:MAG TPA: pantetheine-phosphate adenylyltransferase [Thiotrichaceae bacterium]|jgi:pantetheine-phosphate adenylyltransferase|nr:pantetheine-phosphate adenylyltransferase [Thiotrichaceae bacterium]HIM08088.1 pantetheine-phosphate adenylyltransferase [Gammaproteobacteria bacterium]
MVTAIYPGTFDPITNGHADIATRAASMFEKVIFAVADSSSKKTLFTVDERVELARKVLSGIKNVEVASFNSLITDLAKDKDAKVIVRGIRAVSDFDYEFQMAGMNRQLISNVETVFLTPAENLSFITSSLVREISSFNGDVSKFVDASVLTALKEKHQQ